MTDPVDSFDANWDAMLADLEANGMQEASDMMTEFLATKLPQ